MKVVESVGKDAVQVRHPNIIYNSSRLAGYMEGQTEGHVTCPKQTAKTAYGDKSFLCLHVVADLSQAIFDIDSDVSQWIELWVTRVLRGLTCLSVHTNVLMHSKEELDQG